MFRLLAVTGILAALMACAATADEHGRHGSGGYVPIDEIPEFWRDMAEEHRRFHEMAANTPSITRGQLFCDIVLDVKAIVWGDPHLKVNNKLRLFGPLPFFGNAWLVIPLHTLRDSHPWQFGLYVGMPIFDMPKNYLVKPVMVDPHPPAIGGGMHQYRMKIKDVDPEDKCPNKVSFYNLGHVGDLIDDHPGHAGTER